MQFLQCVAFRRSYSVFIVAKLHAALIIRDLGILSLKYTFITFYLLKVIH